MGQWMRGMVVAVAVMLAPVVALADRGALSLDLGGNVAFLRLDPPYGAGPAASGTTAGAEGAVRYALSNRLEMLGGVAWMAPAVFAHDGVSLTTDNGTFPGKLQSTVSRFQLRAGARYVRGMTLRFFLQGEVGVALTSFSSPDLFDMTNPAAPVSYGLGLASKSSFQFVVAPGAGVEWVFVDHWSVTVAPRVDVFLGAPMAVAVTLPVVVSYSWYGVL